MIHPPLADRAHGSGLTSRWNSIPLAKVIGPKRDKPGPMRVVPGTWIGAIWEELYSTRLLTWRNVSLELLWRLCLHMWSQPEEEAKRRGTQCPERSLESLDTTAPEARWTSHRMNEYIYFFAFQQSYSGFFSLATPSLLIHTGS